MLDNVMPEHRIDRTRRVLVADTNTVFLCDGIYYTMFCHIHATARYITVIIEVGISRSSLWARMFAVYPLDAWLYVSWYLFTGAVEVCGTIRDASPLFLSNLLRT